MILIMFDILKKIILKNAIYMRCNIKYYDIKIEYKNRYYFEERTRDVVANVVDYNIVVNEFELQSRYYVHFRSHTLSEG